MIRFQTISTSDVQHYQFMENLLIAAFPPEEYRELKDCANIQIVQVIFIITSSLTTRLR